MAPSGGYKGFGTGLLVEIFTACIAGGNLGTQASSFRAKMVVRQAQVNSL